jgi:hypothetical protein
MYFNFKILNADKKMKGSGLKFHLNKPAQCVWHTVKYRHDIYRLWLPPPLVNTVWFLFVLCWVTALKYGKICAYELLTVTCLAVLCHHLYTSASSLFLPLSSSSFFFFLFAQYTNRWMVRLVYRYALDFHPVPLDVRGHAVAHWLRHYATKRKVAGSIPHEVNC